MNIIHSPLSLTVPYQKLYLAMQSLQGRVVANVTLQLKCDVEYPPPLGIAPDSLHDCIKILQGHMPDAN